MKDILDELYDCDLFHLTEIADVDGAYKLAMDRLVKAETELLKAFPDCKAMLHEYQSADIDLHNLSNGHEFRKGFRAAHSLSLKCSNLSSEVTIMSRYKSIETAYNPQKKKNVPIWRLDTNTLNVTYFNTDILTEEHKTYNTDYIKYHLHYSDSNYPDRLHRLVNKGKIVKYLDDLELRVGEAISRQVERWKQTDSCYQAAVLSGNTVKMFGLENCFIGMAREVIFDSMVYV